MKSAQQGAGADGFAAAQLFRYASHETRAVKLSTVLLLVILVHPVHAIAEHGTDGRVPSQADLYGSWKELHERCPSVLRFIPPSEMEFLSGGVSEVGTFVLHPASHVGFKSVRLEVRFLAASQVAEADQGCHATGTEEVGGSLDGYLRVSSDGQRLFWYDTSDIRKGHFTFVKVDKK